MLLFALLTACQVTHRPRCESESRSVDDDEELAELGFTVADFAEGVAGARQVEVADGGGVEHQLAVETTRGEGQAKYTEATLVDEETVGFGLGEVSLMIQVQCDDVLEVPAELTAVDDEGLVSILVEATLSLLANVGAGAPYARVSALLSAADVVPGWDGGGAVALQADYSSEILYDFAVVREGDADLYLVSTGEERAARQSVPQSAR